MQPNVITLTTSDSQSDFVTGGNSRSYSKIEQGLKSSLYSDPTRETEVPKTLFISHELGLGGTRRNSAIILKDFERDSEDATQIGLNQVLIKHSVDVKVVTKAAMAKLLLEAGALLIAAANRPGLAPNTDALSCVSGNGADEIESTLDLSDFLNGGH
jgi:hypothetical protein